MNWHAARPCAAHLIRSASSDEQIAVSAVRQGAQDYLAKGQAAPGSLGRAVRYALERHRHLALEVGAG